MDQAHFESLVEDVFDQVRALNKTKGRDYATEDDALAHLREQSTELGLKPEMVWAVLARKHWIAILAYCRSGRVHSEPIEGRLLDMILYCLLLLALSKEQDVQTHENVTPIRGGK